MRKPMSEENSEQAKWVAVFVWRGIPVKAKGYRSRELAEEQAEIWRKEMNPDYDETDVLPLEISNAVDTNIPGKWVDSTS